MKRLTALFLAVLMVFSLLSASALADGETAEELPAAETSPATEEPQTETGENPAENTGETSDESEEKAVEIPAEETPEETSGETPEETSGETPEETSGETPEETSEMTPEEPPADAGNSAETQSGGSDAIADENSSDTTEAENVEAALRAAIANEESSYTIEAGSELVTTDFLTIPSGFTLIVRGKLIAENGVGFMVCEGGSVIVKPEGTLENRGTIDVSGGGCIRNEGTFIQKNEAGKVLIDASVDYTLESGASGHRLEDDLIGIDGKYVRFTGYANTDEELRALLAQVADVGWWEVYIRNSITLSGGDLTIPEKGAIHIGYVTLTVTVPAGTTLTNKGEIYVSRQESLAVEPGAAVVNYGYVKSDAEASIIMNGTWQNCDGAETCIYDGSWSGTGEIQKNGGKFVSYRNAATADALIGALESGVDVVNINSAGTAITLGSSITVPKNVELNINLCKLTVPDGCTLTNHGAISLRGDYGYNGRLDFKGELEILGSYAGDGTILVMQYGILTPDTIPHRAYGVSVSKITVSGDDAVTVGSTVNYTAGILPANAFDPDVTWSIASGSELASISEDGMLTAAAPGEVTVRATAKDGSGVYGDRIVSISTPEAEELYAAVEGGVETSFTVQGNLTLYKELTIPAGFSLTVQGTLVAPEEPGARPAAQESGGIAVQSRSIAVQAGDSAAARSGSGITVRSGGSITVASGGKLENNCRIDMESGSSIAVQAGGMLENNSRINVAGGGCISNDGDFNQTGVPGPYAGNAYVRYTLNEGLENHGLKEDLIGIDRKYVWFEGTATSEKSLRDQLNELEDVPVWGIDLNENVKLTENIVIPDGGSVSVSTETTLTVPKDITLTNNGGLSVKGKLLVESKATLENNGSIEAQSGASVIVENEGTLVNSTGAETVVPADGWQNDGSVQGDESGVTVYKDVKTADELKAALGQYTDVRVTGDITLNESVEIPENVTLRITSGTLTVSEGYALTNSGTIWVDGGCLNVNGTFAGNAVNVNADNVQSKVTPDNVSRLTHGAVAKSITITGDDTVTVGGTAEYAVKTYPEKLEHSGVIWTIVSGRDFASISENGVLTAKAPGEVVIRAATKDASDKASASVYAEKTVTIQGPARLPGDVNGDGEVDIFDCVRLKKYLARIPGVTINASNADVNGDGEVDIFDCVRLKKYLAKIDGVVLE